MRLHESVSVLKEPKWVRLKHTVIKENKHIYLVIVEVLDLYLILHTECR
jgi:hypothetical protein